jgi:hypothetical protein
MLSSSSQVAPNRATFNHHRAFGNNPIGVMNARLFQSVAVLYLVIQGKEIDTLAGLLLRRLYFALHLLCPWDDATVVEEVCYASKARVVTSERKSAVINKKGTTTAAFVYSNCVE